MHSLTCLVSFQLLQTITGTACAPNVVIAMAGISKVYVGEIVEQGENSVVSENISNTSIKIYPSALWQCSTHPVEIFMNKNKFLLLIGFMYIIEFILFVVSPLLDEASLNSCHSTQLSVNSIH